ncbi:Smr/MutS family protein [Hydrogenophilus thiooxidans]|uniref:Smr/MutS family protein n=1 Tax=Hydrogenophilus thiooxidans TaxID=2820326 RepID=UPI001C21ADA1|nr:Smr/MutS family protein [Hydrogenophilus thiooxidans]
MSRATPPQRDWREQLKELVETGALPPADRRRYWRQKAQAALARATPNDPAPRSKPTSSDPAATPASDKPVPAALSPAEARLWQHWLRETGVAPLPPQDRIALERPLPPPTPRQRERDEAQIKTELLAPLTLDDWLDHDSETFFLRPGVPRRMVTEMRRGRWTIRRQLDLHGLTREEARAALSAFLAEALRTGERCVRIIHGKGYGSPGGVSVLKHLSRQWLTRREEILAFCEAAPRQGGSGALLVLLRAPSANR